MPEQQIEKLRDKVLNGESIQRQEALALAATPAESLDALCEAADEIRRKFCSDGFDICTIINAKSGRCSENCKYCAQSSFYKTKAEEYPLLSAEKILEQARHNAAKGVLRYSLVTSGRKLGDRDVEKACDIIHRLKEETDIEICVSFGLLDEAQFSKIKAAGATRVHNNLESSRRYFPSICTTHTFDDKLRAIRAAQRAGLNVCSGGIMGLGESMEDRIDMALTLRELGVRSVPVNILNPIPGTPYECRKRLTAGDIRRIVAVFRFLLPDASIRLAGGRGLLDDKGERCFTSGANAAISGDMLTTSGITIEKDMAMLKRLGYTPKLWNR